MDLKSYIESELEEDKNLGYDSTAGAGARNSDGYPGDPAVLVAADSVRATVVTLDGDHGAKQVYVARPAGDGPAPAVIVIHENKGLVPYIRNATRRLAAAGYVAIAPDLLSGQGGTGSFADPADATKALGERDGDEIVSDVRAVLAEIANWDFVDGDKLGILGFCWGGGVSWKVLLVEPNLKTGIPFYGPTPDADKVSGISAPVLAIYGELDERITGMQPGIEKAMNDNGKTFKSVIFPGAQHAFHNDTNPDRYNAAAAAEAWATAVGWLDEWVK